MNLVGQLNQEKSTEAATIFLKLHGGKMNYMLLVKLLYFLDREAFARWERPVTNDSYVSLKYGPVVSTILNIIRGKISSAEYWDEYIETLPDKSVSLKNNPPKIKKLSPAEVGLISELDARFGGIDPFILANKMHDLPEYHDPQGSSLPISRESMLAGIGYSEDEISRILAEIQDEEELDSVLA